MTRFMVISLTVLMPFVFSVSTLDPVLVPSLLLLALVLLLMSLREFNELIRLRQPADYSIWRRSIVVYSLAYFAFCAISLIQAVNLAEAVFEMTRVLLVFVLLLIASARFSAGEDAVETLIKGCVISALVMSAICVCQYLVPTLDWFSQNGVPSGTMANKGLLTSYLSMLLPFLVLGSTRNGALWRTLSFVALAAAVLVIVIAQTRATWVAIVVAAALTGLLAVLTSRRLSAATTGQRILAPRRLVFAALLIVILAVIGLEVFPGIAFESLADRATSIVSRNDSSIHERLVLWSKMLQMSADHPLAGVGVGNCKIMFPSYGIAGTIQESGEVFFQRPHNDYLWVLTETGVGGLAVYLLVFVAAVMYAFRLLRSPTTDGDRPLVLALLFAVICYAVDSFFSFPKERFTHLAIVTLTFAILTALYHRTFPISRSMSRRTAIGIISVCVIISAASIAVGVIRLRAEQHTSQALVARNSGNWRHVIDEIDRGRSALATLDPTSTPLSWYRGVANWSLGNFDQASADFAQAFRDNPNHIHVLTNLAACYERKGEHERAIEYYQRVLEMNPGFLEGRLNLAAVQYNSGNFNEANETLTAIARDCVDSRYLLLCNKIRSKLGADSTVTKK